MGVVQCVFFVQQAQPLAGHRGHSLRMRAAWWFCDGCYGTGIIGWVAGVQPAVKSSWVTSPMFGQCRCAATGRRERILFHLVLGLDLDKLPTRCAHEKTMLLIQ
jgi:hypothetical protein